MGTLFKSAPEGFAFREGKRRPRDAIARKLGHLKQTS